MGIKYPKDGTVFCEITALDSYFATVLYSEKIFVSLYGKFRVGIFHFHFVQ